MKYSEMLKWKEEMLREVGLNVPPIISGNLKQSDEIEVLFIKRKKLSK